MGIAPASQITQLICHIYFATNAPRAVETVSGLRDTPRVGRELTPPDAGCQGRDHGIGKARLRTVALTGRHATREGGAIRLLFCATLNTLPLRCWVSRRKDKIFAAHPGRFRRDASRKEAVMAKFLGAPV